jgi:bacteriorhodopsin
LAGLHYQHEYTEKSECVLCVAQEFLIVARSRDKGVKNMLAIIATVLIVLWLLGFLAFHVSSGFIHILLVIGIVMLLLHFFRNRASTV